MALAAAALALRLPRLAETPGWDGDEGYNLDIAWHLLQGRAQFFALDYAFVQHPPLFYVLVAPLVGVLGRELVAVRIVAAVASSLSAVLLYGAVAAASGRRPALLAGVVLAGAHFCVLYGRFGYTYNLLLLWSAATLACVVAWRRSDRRPWLWLGTAAAALGLLTDQEGIFLPLFLAASIWPRRRLAVITLAVGSAPAFLVALAMLVATPEIAVSDWAYSFLRLQGAGRGEEQGPAVAAAHWFVNYLHLLRAEWWLPLGVAGLFCIQPLAARRTALLLTGLMVVPIFALRELDPFFRTGIPLLLPLSWGAGALLDAGMAAVFGTFGKGATSAASTRRAWTRSTSAMVAALVVILPLGLELGRSAGAAGAGFRPRFDWALVTEGEAQREARAAAAYVNDRARANDVVVVSPAVAWLYEPQTADFFQSVAREGEPLAFYPANLPRARFRFDPSLGGARYAVVDPFWLRWAAEVPAVRRHLDRVESATIAAEIGQIRIFAPSPRSA